MFITKKHLPRRTFLKGVGATLALPMLDAMVPAFAATAKQAPRLGFVYVPHGAVMAALDAGHRGHRIRVQADR